VAREHAAEPPAHARQRLRAYEYYFASCEGAFQNNQMQLSHFLFAKRVQKDAPFVGLEDEGVVMRKFMCAPSQYT
jgi:hypothetical protein